MKVPMLKNNFFISFINMAVIVVLVIGCATTAPRKKIAEEQEADKKIAGDLFLEGKMAEAKKSWTEAIAAYTEALQYDPQSDEIAYAIARAFLNNRKNRSSLHYTKMAIRLNSSEAKYWQLLQYLEEQGGRLDNAADALEMYMKLNPEYDFIHTLKLSQYYFALDRKKDAKKILISKAKDTHTSASEIYEIASIMATNGLIEDAISVYNSLIERDPLDVQAWLLLGDLYESTGRKDEALETYREALEKNSDNLLIILSIGNSCLMENDWDCAIKHFEKAYSAGSEKAEDAGITYLDIPRTLTAVYFYAGKDKDAIALYDSLKTAGEDDAKLYFSLGKAMNFLERYDEAESYYRKGFEKDVEELSENSIYRAYIGFVRALIKLEREDEALKLIHDDAKKYIKNTTRLKELEATILRELKRYDDAIAIYEWLLASDPENRAYHLSISLVYDLNGQFEKAEESLLKVLELSPDDPLALNNLAYMYLENDVNISKALKMVRQALTLDPENGAYLDTLGWAYYKLGKYKEARKQIEKSLKLADREDKGIIYDHYGNVLIKLGKKKEAVEAYRNAIDFGEDEERILPKINSITQ